MRIAPKIFLVFALTACSQDGEVQEPPIRGLKTHLVANSERSAVRRFPAVLEPISLNTLSFEVSGKLDAVSLEVGQRVKKRQTLLTLDETAFQIQLDNAEAGISAAQAERDNAIDNLKRQETLFRKKIVSEAIFDRAVTEAAAAESRLEQAIKAWESAKETLNKTNIYAPFDGIINSVDATSFGTISAGMPMVSIYSPDQFEISFSVNFDTVSQLVVGTPATVRLADLPNVSLNAVVSELGARADSVSSFPVVLSLKETDPVLKAGMAVEASIEVPLPAERGFTLPLSALLKKGQIGAPTDQPAGPGVARVYIYNPSSETVNEREIKIADVRENSVIVVDGLAAGELVASAGVTFLRDGMRVKLIDGDE